mmetsp:Transcript_21489/g.34748  ORF Transcript_21489/g.34748 Transcript_21489/m.34748 type:complete len:123 (+) Transcript_21489:1083-1451(+)
MPYHVGKRGRIAKMTPGVKGIEPVSETMVGGGGEAAGRTVEETATGIIETTAEKEKGRGEEEKTVGNGDVMVKAVEGSIAETATQGRGGGVDEMMVEVAGIAGEGETETEIRFGCHNKNSQL